MVKHTHNTKFTVSVFLKYTSGIKHVEICLWMLKPPSLSQELFQYSMVKLYPLNNDFPFPLCLASGNHVTMSDGPKLKMVWLNNLLALWCCRSDIHSVEMVFRFWILISWASNVSYTLFWCWTAAVRWSSHKIMRVNKYT